MAGPAYSSGTILISKNEDWQTSLQYLTMITDPINGTPINLTGSRLCLQIRSVEESHSVLCETATDGDGGIAIYDAINGIFTMTIWNAQSANLPNSANLPEGDFVADLVRTLADGREERLWEGTVTVNEGTTR